MPLASFKQGREDTTLVFDTWADLSERSVAIHWDAALSDEETTLLEALAARLGYLGRSESWTNARVARPDEELPLPNCVPVESLANPGPGWEQVPILATIPAEQYRHWYDEITANVLEPLALPPGRKPSKSLLGKREKAIAPYPPDLIACLQADTSWHRKCGWSQPPGSRRVIYWRPADILEPGAPRLRPAVRSATTVETVLLALATESGNDHALPTIVRTLPQAELLHQTLGGQVKRIAGYSPVLSGCDPEGRRLSGPHRHAHILPLDLDDDGHLEHILIWAPMGLDQIAQTAVRAVRQSFTKGGVGRIQVAVAAAGSLTDLPHLPGRLGNAMASIVGPPAGAVEWVSVTPFVPPRYIKARGKNSLEGQVNAELGSRKMPQAVHVERFDPWNSKTPMVSLLEDGVSGPGSAPQVPGLEWARFRHFVRTRRKGAPPPMDCGFALRLRFAEPVRGLISLGYGSHFGLGLFRSIDPDSQGKERRTT